MPRSACDVVRFLFSLEGRVSRRDYLSWGAMLMVAKYALDALITFAADGAWLSPLHFLSPVLQTRDALLGSASGIALGAMLLVALPFLWVGVSMSVRRAEDAGQPSFLGLLFVLPIINWLLILTLCLLRTKPEPARTIKETPQSRSATRAALSGVGYAVAVAVPCVALSTLLLGAYGGALFFATPFAMGCASSYTFNTPERRSIGATLLVALSSVVICSAALLLFALEGLFCIAMAFPIAVVTALFGALVTRAVLGHGGAKPSAALPMLVALPMSGGAEQLLAPDLAERVVRTEIIIDAPAEAVWENVIAFPPLPKPTEWYFKGGIAYPTGATIDGSAAGAVRHCNFSTGPFVEPITHWDEPRRLAFNVESQPEPMRELSPHEHIFAPHLHGYLSSRRGEFLLERLPGDKTRLRGSTWYALDVKPTRYWALWTDAIIGRIHLRVLEHIAAQTTRAGLRVTLCEPTRRRASKPTLHLG